MAAHFLKALPGFDDDRMGVLCLPAEYRDCSRVDGHGTQGAFSLRLQPQGHTDLGPWKVGHKIPFGAKWLDLKFVDRFDKPLFIRLYAPYTTLRSQPWRDIVVQSRVNEPVMIWGERARYGRHQVLKSAIPVPPRWQGRIWPVYKGIPGRLTGERVELALQSLQACAQTWDEACAAAAQRLLDALPPGTLDENQARSLFDAVHAPQTLEQAQDALDRARDLQVQSIFWAAHQAHRRQACDAPLRLDPAVVDHYAHQGGPALTRAQQQAVAQIKDLIGDPRPGSILLNADVGTGKTRVYLTLALAAQRAGYRVAVMAPSDLLADQIARVAQDMALDTAGVERVKTGRKIVHPQFLLIGTSGMASQAARQHIVPDWLIIDEQQKFSIEQRQSMVGSRTHVLEVTATPIPRSMARMLFGQSRIVTLSEAPVSRTIQSEICTAKDRARLSGLIRSCAQKGERLVVIYPLVQHDSSRMSILQAAQSLQSILGPDRVAVLHGDMKTDERAVSLEAFRRGDRPIMLATTLFETGIDVPDVRYMIVRDPQYFGAAQLHQLRGRLARNGGQARFMLFVDCERLEDLNPVSVQRLRNVVSCQDGYALTQADLALRGMGDVGENGDQTGRPRGVFWLDRLDTLDIIERWKRIQNETSDEKTTPSPKATQDLFI